MDQNNVEYQHTIKKLVWVPGIDLPSGNDSGVYVEPAALGTGIVFRTPGGEEIKATLENTSSSLFWFAKTCFIRK